MRFAARIEVIRADLVGTGCSHHPRGFSVRAEKFVAAFNAATKIDDAQAKNTRGFAKSARISSGG